LVLDVDSRGGYSLRAYPEGSEKSEPRSHLTADCDDGAPGIVEA